MSTEQGFWDSVDAIRDGDARFRREAYGFLAAALAMTVRRLPRERFDDPVRRHLSGRELLTSLVRVARSEFGELAPMVFAEWGVRSGRDVGEMVFQLVRSGQMTARPEDTLDDFEGFDLARELLAEPGRTPRA